MMVSIWKLIIRKIWRKMICCTWWRSRYVRRGRWKWVWGSGQLTMKILQISRWLVDPWGFSKGKRKLWRALERDKISLERIKKALKLSRKALEHSKRRLRGWTKIWNRIKRIIIGRRMRKHKVAIRVRMSKIRCIRKDVFMKNDIPGNENRIGVEVKHSVSFDTREVA